MRFHPLRALLITCILVASLAAASFHSHKAQACGGYLSVCEPAGQADITFPTLEQAVQAIVDIIVSAIPNFFQSVFDNLMTTVLDTISGLVMDNLTNFIDSFWQESLDPDMKNMARQLNTAIIDQTRLDGSLRDAALQVEVQRERQKVEAAAQKRYRPSEKVCQTASIVGGLNRAKTISRAMMSARTREAYDRSRAKKDSPQARGNATDMVQHKLGPDRYQKFCDPEANKGDPLDCPLAADDPLVNADLKPAANIFLPRTHHIDDESLLIREAIREQIIEPRVSEPIPQDVMDGHPDAVKAVVMRRSHTARRNIAHDAFSFAEGVRTPGSKMTGWLEDIYDNAGIPANDPMYPPPAGGATPVDPSHYNVMHGLTLARYWDPKYFATIGVDPQRERLELGAIKSIQMRDFYELTEHQAMLLAVQTTIDLDKNMLGDGRTEEEIVTQ